LKQFQRTLICASLMATLAGCASTDKQSFPIDSSDQSFSVNKSILAQEKEKELSPEVGSAVEQAQKEFESKQLPSLPSLVDIDIPAPNEVPKFASESKITVSVDEIGIVDFIHHVYGDLLSLDYVLSPEVEKNREKVILNLQQPVTRTELFTLASNLLSERKIQVSSKDNIIFFSKKDSSTKANTAIGIGSEESDIPNVQGKIIQLIPYVYNSSGGISRIVTKLSDASVYAYDDQKLMVVEGVRDEVIRVQRLVQMLDVPAIKGRDIRMLNISYVSVDDIIKNISSLLKEEGLRVGSSGDTALVPIESQNAIVVYSSNRTIGERVVDWAEKLDKPATGDKPSFYIFRPKYSKAVDINEALSSFFGGGSKDGGVVIKDSKSFGNVKISVDKVQNSLLINATSSEYKNLLSLLKKLDQLPGQVALDVTIAEVDLSDDFKAGITSLVVDSAKDNGKSGKINMTPFSGRVGIEAIVGAATINMEMLEEKKDVKVLSRPYIVVQDGQSASINSGKQVPVQVGQTVSDGGNKTTEVQYRNTGIHLSVTPTINSDGIIALQVAQSVSNTEKGPATLNPIITNRSVTTQVMVGDGKTAILGGLVQEDKSKGHNGVPILKDIPLIGGLFSGHTDSFSRSELVILITPRILRSTTDLDEFSNSVEKVFSFPIEIKE